MQSAHLRFRLYIAASLFFFLFLGLAPVKAALLTDSGSSLNTEHVSNQAPCFFSQSLIRPSRQVLQVIDNQFFKWYEYDQKATGTTCIYLVEPEKKALTPAEAAKLLQASREWERQGLPGGSLWEEPGFGMVRTAAFQLTIDPPPGFEGNTAEETMHLESMADNRTPVSGSSASSEPFYNIGFLAINFPSGMMRGTGFMISPYVVMTNGHNVYAAGMGGWYKTIQFSPGQYETEWPISVQPFSSLQPVKAATNDSYLIYEDQSDRDNTVKYDYAALFFDQVFTGITTFMPLQFNYTPGPVLVVGYPGLVNGVNTVGMWRSEGKYLEKDSHCLYYDAYTSGGSSGSPVLYYSETAGTYRVVAIHSFAFAGDLIVSGGPHFNDKNRQIIEQWLQWTPDPPAGGVTSITLNRTTMTLEVGDREPLVATVTPEDAPNKQLAWSSSDEAVASVDNNGVVAALKLGSAIITASTLDGSRKATCSVNVQIDRESLAIGDLTGDGVIDVRDVALILQHTLGLIKLDAETLSRADINSDGIVNVLDVALLMQFSLGLISSFPSDG
jgi:V8-like Glu-specific endopeptidase